MYSGDEKEYDADEGVDWQLFETNPTRNVVGANFANGVVEFPFTVGAPNAWLPCKSYCRMSLTLYGAADNGPVAPTMSELLALADNCVGNMFNGAYLRANNVSISENIQGLPQCSAARVRLGKSFSELRSLGATDFNESRFMKRALITSSDQDCQAALTDMNDTYVPAEIGFFNTAAVTWNGGSNQIVGTNTNFTTGMPLNGAPTGGPVVAGDIIVILGVAFQISGVADATHITVVNNFTAGLGQNTDNWYIIRKDNQRSPLINNTVYVTWQPPIGVFWSDIMLGSGDFRLILNPNGNYLTAAVETKNPQYQASIDGLTGTYGLVVNEMKFYTYIKKMKIPNQIQQINYCEMLATNKPWLSNLQFTVPMSTYAISIFVTDSSSGQNPLLPPSMFKLASGVDLKLQQIQVTYAGITKTSTPWQSNYARGVVGGNNGLVGIDQLQQRYKDTYEESGLWKHDGVESFYDYLQRGPIYHYAFPRAADNRATEVQVNTQFGSTPTSLNGTPALIWLIAWYHRRVEITCAAGQIVQVIARQI